MPVHRLAFLALLLATAPLAVAHTSPIRGTIAQGEVDTHPGGALCIASPFTRVVATLTINGTSPGDAVALFVDEGPTNVPAFAVATHREPRAVAEARVLIGCGDPTFTVVGLRVADEVAYEIIWARVSLRPQGF